MRLLPALPSCAALGLALTTTAFAAAPSAERLAAWNELQGQNHGTLSISWSVTTGTPEIITNLAVPPTGRPPLRDLNTAALKFFEQHAALFSARAGLDGFRITRTSVRERLQHVGVQQTYRGVPVEGANYALTFYPDGTFSMLAGYFYPNLELDVVPTIKPERAHALALEKAGVATNLLPFGPELTILAGGGAPRLVYSVRIRPTPFGASWEAIVDARSGEVVEIRDRMTHATALTPDEPGPRPAGRVAPGESPLDPQMICDSSPMGNYYNTDPCETGIWSDFFQRLDPPVDDYYKLKGSWVEAQDTLGVQVVLCGQFTGTGWTPPGQYQDRYAPDNSHFDESNLYFHVDRFIQHFVTWHSFSPLWNEPNQLPRYYLKAVSKVRFVSPQGVSTINNASFDDATGSVQFGPGNYDEGYDFAKKDDIIYHEVAHGIAWGRGFRRDPANPNHDSHAIDEGMADYFAASYTNEPEIGECHIAYCILPNQHERTCLNSADGVNGWRVDNLNNLTWFDCNGDAYFANSDPHYAGMIWSGTLWELRTTYGANVVDALAYGCIDNLLGLAPTWKMMGEALMNEERSRGGAYLCTIKDLLRRRGFFPYGITIPTMTAAAFDPTDCRVEIAWSIPVAEQEIVDGFHVYRNGVRITGAPLFRFDRSFNDTPGPGSHGYQVTALDCGAETLKSNTLTAVVPNAPNAPTGVSASDALFTYVRVNWTDNASNETSYKIERRIQGSGAVDQTFTASALAGTGSVGVFDDNTLTTGTTYDYCVKAVGTCNLESGAACDPGRRTPPPLVVTISGPTTRNANQSGTWTIAASGTAPYTYQWQKYRDCQEFAPAAMTTDGDETMAPTCWQWIAIGSGTNSLTTSDAVDFRVKCVVTDAAGLTGFSQRNVNVPTSTGEPQAPVSSVAATDGDPTVSKVKVTWGPSDGAEGFRVYRAGTLIATLAQNDRSYVDPSAPNAISQYCVVAYSGTINSGQVCNNGYPYVPLTATISGPTQLNYNQSGTYTVNVTSGGIPPLTRQWYKTPVCTIEPGPQSAVAPGGEEIMIPPCDEPFPIGTGGTSVSTTGTYDFEISCRVTDAVGRQSFPVRFVNVLGVSPAAVMTETGGARDPLETLPTRTELLPGGANPIRGMTTVDFALAEPGSVSLTVFDIAGRRVESLADAAMPRGRHRVSWNASKLPAGMYLYRFAAGGVTSTRRFMVVR